MVSLAVPGDAELMGHERYVVTNGRRVHVGVLFERGAAKRKQHPGGRVGLRRDYHQVRQLVLLIVARASQVEVRLQLHRLERRLSHADARKSCEDLPFYAK